MQVLEVVVESDEERLRKVYVLCRNDKSEREGAQNEYRYGHERAHDDGLGVVLARIVDLHDVYAHHLHSGVEEEYAAGKYQIVEFGKVGPETLRHVHIVVSARGEIYDAEDYEQRGGDYGSDHTAPFADLADPAETLERDECREPIYCQHYGQREDLVRCERHVVRLVGTDEGYGHGAECEHGGIPYCRFDPLQEYGQKSCSGAESLAHPAEDAALLVGEHGGQLGGHQRCGDQEDDGCEEVVEGRREPIYGLGGEPSQTYHGRDVHYGERHDREFESCACFCTHGL